jgi:D-glycero-alpha-D-manno-heptose 1-phosphate guanylyltransferase
MQANEAIILAGGFGTRLKEAVPDLPKCMAPVAGQPFLFHVINYLRSCGIEKFIFSLGYKHEIIEQYLEEKYPTLDYQAVVEEQPLGTGGAIRLACSYAAGKQVVATNGDTIFKADIKALSDFHQQVDADCTLALKPLRNFDRYGVVQINSANRVTAFKEKQFYASGLINGGLYIINRERVLAPSYPARFSFEKDYLEKAFPSGHLFGLPDDGYFIDIGIPGDFYRAQEEMARPPLDLKSINREWTLFIDRDGVINREKKEEYIRNWGEFSFYEGVSSAFAILAQKFGKIIVISNQRGVGRGLMTEADLQDIHHRMKRELERAGGRIDAIYYCTSTDNKHAWRKPNPGLAFQAKKDFPEIDLSRTIMVGNKPSDMLFGRYAGIYTVFVQTTNPEHPANHSDIDLSYATLEDFAKAL